MKTSEHNTNLSNSQHTIGQKIKALASASIFALMSYVGTVPILNATPTPEQTKKPTVQKVVMPGLQFKTYDAQGKTLEDWVRLEEKHILYPPFVVPYGGSFELSYQNGTIVHANRELDVLISDIKGNYLNNAKPLRNRRPRAFPTRINTAEAGMKPDTFYAFFGTDEKAASLELREVGPNPSKEILASAKGLLYVKGECPPPEIQIKEVKKEVPVKEEKPVTPPSIAILTTEKQPEPKNPCDERITLIGLGAFYTNKKDLGLELVIEKSLSRRFMAGIEVFAMPSSKQNRTDNFQDDSYTVGEKKLRGKTDLETEIESDIYGVAVNALFGDQCKVMVGPILGIGMQKDQLNYTFRQTVEDVTTGKLLDEYVCKAGSDNIKQVIYNAGIRAIIKAKNRFYIGVEAGVLANLLKKTDVSYLNGAIKKALELGPGTKIYIGINANF